MLIFEVGENAFAAVQATDFAATGLKERSDPLSLNLAKATRCCAL